MKFHEAVLGNGLQIVAELNPAVYSVAASFLVRTGSRDETEGESGVSHFLEHMAFKGNDRFTADDVNRIFDEIGAENNASTSEEVTQYHAVFLPEYLPTVMEVLSGLLTPALRQEDYDLEKQVILEEIGMYQDQPSWVAYEHAMESHFKGHPLGQCILGTTESITELTSEQMRAYHARHYTAGNVVLAVTGNTDWDVLQEQVEQFCGGWKPGHCDRIVTEASPVASAAVLERESSLQEQVVQMAPAPPARSELRLAAELLATVVGDSSGSRLYWDLVDSGEAEVAELGYNEYDGSGVWMTWLSCLPKDTERIAARIAALYAEVNRSGVTEAELDRARNKVASRVVLRSERPMGRLSSVSTSWMYRGEYLSVEEELRQLQAVTLKDIQQLLEAYPLRQVTTVAIGPCGSLNFG
ncbi:MAG: insulinase family protein [Planctomycetaceae bacterium]|nr:insulinase family protein [Planctomycetaceae bacterium]